MSEERDSSRHAPVLLAQVLEAARLVRRSSPLYLDATLGGGGHAEALLTDRADSFLVGLDADQEALARSAERLAAFGNRILLLRSNFRHLDELGREVASWLRGLGRADEIRFDFVLADLGISSDQLDEPRRGFSYRGELLDMRIDQSTGETAQEILNQRNLHELTSVFRRGGVASGARQLADAVIRKRPIVNGSQFVSICDQVFKSPGKKRRNASHKHSALVPFQALRIEVNQEFAALAAFLERVPAFLAAEAVLAVISFHSLEDQIVTSQMRQWSRSIAPRRGLPESQPAVGALLTKEAIKAGDEELNVNPRSRSALLRIFQKGVH